MSKPTRRVKPTPMPLEPPWTADHVARLGAVSDRTLAAELGISPHRVKRERAHRGIAPCGAGRRSRGEVAMTVRRSVPLTEAEAAEHDRARGEQPWAEWIRDAARAAVRRAADREASAKLTARLARTEALRTARAELRCELAAKMGRSPFDAEVIKEANAQLRNAGWRV